METTPLELYETAYKFHYHENRLADAVAYYEKLIKEFPDSNECGYSVIQLQKIKAHDVAEALQKQNPLRASAAALHPVTLMALLVSIAAIGAFGFSYRTISKKIALERRRTSLAVSILGKISRRENNEALQQLSELKEIYPDDITPWELAADIYRKQHQFEKARKEYADFFDRNPGRTPTESERYFMELQKETPTPKKPSVYKAPPPVAPDIDPTAKKRLSRSRKKAVKPPQPGPTKKKKGLFLVDPDSISYF